ncbi:MAG: laminin B domain-containing protein [Phycisphaerae bacterium]
MNRVLISMAALAMAAAFSTAAVSTFGTDDEGWTITGDAQGGGATPTWESSGGNPGGYISATDDVQGGTWYFNAPAAFHGDFSSAYGTSLTFDLRQSSTSSQFNNVDVYLRGGGLDLTFDTASNPGTDWTGYSLLLTESGGWQLSGSAPTQAEFQQVLGDVTDLQIRGEYVSGSDVGDLDNVVFLPEPATMVLLGIGGLAMLRRSRR